MNLPLYKIVVNLDDDTEYMSCISLVENPAVSVDFLAFNKQKQDDDIKLLSFDKESVEHKITGVSIRCDYPIYRIDNFGKEYFVVFDKETIENIVLKYSKMGMNNLVSLQHNGQLVDGVYMIEYFIKDSTKGLVPKGFEHIEDGSLFCSYKIENERVWQEVTSGNCKGFSIEINAELEQIKDVEIPIQEEDYLDTLIAELLKDFDCEILFSDSKKKIIEKALKDKEHITIKQVGTSKTINGWIYANVDDIVYVWDNQRFYEIESTNIESVSITKVNTIPNWTKAEQHPYYPQIREKVKSGDNVTDIGSVDNNLIYDSIFNHNVVMLRYDDESGEGCTTYRQVLICEYGITRKGNTAIRAYEYSGSTHTNDISPLPEWRTFLIKRIINIKPTPQGLFQPITQAPPKFNPNPIKDRDDFQVIWKSVFD